ncbi:MAG: DUF2293 domain-containing protein, partial [Thermoanaerobaculia bacterium]
TRDDIVKTEPKEKKNELVVFAVRSRDSKCSECGDDIGGGRFLRKEGDRGLCLDCADLGDLVFLGAGDPALTRRATKYSPLRAVVVEWSRSRKRYERQGILVTPEAIERAERECLDDEEIRMRRQLAAAARREVIDAAYVGKFAEKIREHYPILPGALERDIAEHACRKYSGRVGRSAAAKEFDPAMIELAVRAHIRHELTNYDELLASGLDREDARREVRAEVTRVAHVWAGRAAAQPH